MEQVSEASPAVWITSVAAAVAVYIALPKKVRLPKNTVGDAPYPPRVSYRIPFLGSAMEFSKNGMIGFIRKKSSELGNAPIIAAHVAGRTMHFVANPAAFSAPFRYSEEWLSMAPAIMDFSKSFFGMSAAGLETFDRPGLKAVADHMLKPAGLLAVTQTIQNSIQVHLKTAPMEKSDLSEFVHNIMFRVVLESIISKSVSHQEFIDNYFEFEQAMMIAFAGLPMNVFAPRSHRARERIAKWLQDANLELTPYLQSRREYLQSKSMSMDDVARDNLLWTWASVSNFLPTIFWFIYFVATDRDATDAVRRELDEVVGKNSHQGGASLSLEQLDSMNTMDAIFKETLRVSESFMVSREVMRDMELDLRLKGGKSKYFLKKGDNLVLLTPVLHHDPVIFPNPEEFQWDRFLKLSTPITMPDGEKVSDPFKAFGGGPHYCPGRKFAALGAKAFLANVFLMYDVMIDGSTALDNSRDGLGVLHPETPVQLRLSERQK